MANGSPPLPRQVIKRVPPNVPRDVAAMEHPSEFDPYYMYGMGAPRSRVGIGSLAQIVFPPWVYPPQEAGLNFYFGTAATALGVGPLVQELAPSVFQVPNSFVGVIREITLNVNNLLATSGITFRLLFNGGAVQGYDNMAVFPRALASFSSNFGPDSTMIFVPEGVRISFQVQVTDAAAYTLGASYRGWIYSKDVAARYHAV